MGELRLPGLATGIDTATLIQQMMTINSRKLASYQVKKIGYESQVTALDELRTKVNALKSSASALSDADELDGYSASSSDTDMLTISVSTGANPSSHSVEINQLATSETWIQDVSTFDHETDYVGGGDFIYSYNNHERVITAVDGETTLQDMVNLINNDVDNPGVSASLLYQGDKYHLMLSGQETGEDYQISINDSSTEVLMADSALTLESDDTQNAGLTTKITELSQFGESDLESGETITISGTVNGGAAITSLDISITDETTVGHLIAKINTAFTGVSKATLDEGKIVLTDLTSGASTLTMDLTYNANGSAATLTLPTIDVSNGTEGGTAATLATFASGTFIETQSAQNSQIKIDDYSPTAVAEEQTLTPTIAPTSGTYTLTFEGQTTGSISYAATAAQIQTELNGLSNVEPGDIVVTDSGTEGIKDGNLTFTFLSTAGNVGMIAIDPANLDQSAVSNYTIAETIEGYNAQWIQRNSNSITDALGGVTLNLKDITEVDDPVKITISRSTGAVIGKVNALADAYNVLLSELKSKTEYNAEEKKMGILNRDITASFMKTQIKYPFLGIIDGFLDTEDSFTQASDIGISFDGSGAMEIDSDVFSDAVNEDYSGVLELLGATKTGNSSSDIIQFYDASDRHTEAGTYDVEVTIADLGEGNVITAAKMKLSTESQWSTATWSGTLVTGDSTFDDDGTGPLYPENGLQVVADLSDTGVFTATVRVKQGMAGVTEDLLATALESDGQFDRGQEIINDRITSMQTRIEAEEKRLNNVETRLITKYARLERILTMMQQQQGAVSMVAAASLG